jgi:hypothetical protein
MAADSFLLRGDEREASDVTGAAPGPLVLGWTDIVKSFRISGEFG